MSAVRTPRYYRLRRTVRYIAGAALAAYTVFAFILAGTLDLQRITG